MYMIKKIRKSLLLLGGIGIMSGLASCEMETSDNGELDGFWHLEQVDTLATGGVCDYRNVRIFWGIEHNLVSISDYETFKDFRGYYARFRQTGDSLVLTKFYRNNWHQAEGDKGGDIPITEMNDTMRRVGINRLEESFYKDHLSGGYMTLSTKELRLRFKKF